MDFKVIFKDPFLEDLERIVRLIAAREPTAARRFDLEEQGNVEPAEFVGVQKLVVNGDSCSLELGNQR